MKHVCRIARVIQNPAGHAMLVGVGGSGKQSLSKLASHICGYYTFQITISAQYVGMWCWWGKPTTDTRGRPQPSFCVLS